MKVSKKLGMYAGVSAAALGFGLIAAPASAFDEVNWTWDATINEEITKNININADLVPSGMAMLQDLQVSIGDHSASSSVNDVFNNQPGQLDFNGSTELEFDVVWGTEGGRVSGDNAFSETTLSFIPDENITFFDLQGDEIPSDIVLACVGGTNLAQTCDSEGFFTMVVDVEGEGEIIVTAEFDALTELPEVISAATAVANNTAIETDTSVQLHEGQFAFGDGGNGGFDSGLSFNGDNWDLDGEDLNGVNSNLVAAGVLSAAAILGYLEKANIDADSQVSNIHNATVDSSATAVVNNMSVDIAAEGNDRLLIGDVVQFSYADTNAMSDVQGIYLNSYTNLGLIDRPIVNSVATAVGNNKSISVSAPTADINPSVQ